MSYAADTTVPVEEVALGKIERILARYGATSFAIWSLR